MTTLKSIGMVVFFVFVASTLVAPAIGDPTTQPAENRWAKKLSQPGITKLQKAAYEQLALMPECDLQQISVPGSYNLTMPAKGTPDAAGQLLGMGPKVIPILVEALDDTTMTKTVTMMGNGRKFDHRANELVGRIIRQLCDRDFAVGEMPNEHTLWDVGDHPELAPQFQTQILDWYKNSQGKSEIERKLVDLEDSWFRNRLDAVEWFGQHKEAKGVPAIEKYIDRSIASIEKQEDSLTVSELSEALLALGQIGDKDSLPSARKGCQEFTKIWETYRFPTGSMDISDLVQAYHGLAMLGDKDSAIKELTRIFDKNKDHMEAHSIDEFKGDLQDAKGW